jgi:RHS repeat-associated protein
VARELAPARLRSSRQSSNRSVPDTHQLWVLGPLRSPAGASSLATKNNETGTSARNSLSVLLVDSPIAEDETKSPFYGQGVIFMREITGCRYSYDPLDRLIGTLSLTDTQYKRFYCKNRFATELQGAVKYSIFRHEDQILAQLQSSCELLEATLLVTNHQHSVVHARPPQKTHSIVYSPYGHRVDASGLHSLLGFNGERVDPATGYYLLGNGYRAFSPVLMRFISPDNLSPFEIGGINSYAYCQGDPVNHADENGHFSVPVRIANQLTSALRRARERLVVTQIPERRLQQNFHNERYSLGNISVTLRNTVSNKGSTTHFTYTSGLKRTVHNEKLTLQELGYNATPGKYLKPKINDIPTIPEHTLKKLEWKLTPVNFNNYMAHTHLISSYGKNFEKFASNLLQGEVTGVPPQYAAQQMKNYIRYYTNNDQPHSGLKQSYMRALQKQNISIRHQS